LRVALRDPMAQAKLTIGELEAGYPLYCKALRRLLKEGRSTQDIQKTVCWGHLETLNRCLPTRYKAPSYLLALIRRDLEQPKH
jgi:hypothetical protein